MDGVWGWVGGGFIAIISTISFEFPMKSEVKLGVSECLMQGKEKEKKIKPIKQPVKAVRAPTLLDKAARHE